MKRMYVYMLQCNDRSYYTGVTNDLERRLIEHNEGLNKNCYTFSRRPLELMFYEIFDSPASAIAFEKKIKGWSRAKKKALIEKNWEKLHLLAKCQNETSHENYEKGFDFAQPDQGLSPRAEACTEPGRSVEGASTSFSLTRAVTPSGSLH